MKEKENLILHLTLEFALAIIAYCELLEKLLANRSHLQISKLI